MLYLYLLELLKVTSDLVGAFLVKCNWCLDVNKIFQSNYSIFICKADIYFFYSVLTENVFLCYMVDGKQGQYNNTNVCKKNFICFS